MNSKPIVYDLYAGLGGWSQAFIDEGYTAIGFDIEAHDYGTGGYPGKLILRDVRSIHGSELKDATCIVGSSPCQEFSYRAMPWKRAKALGPPTLGMELFNAQFRIQREAIEAAGHYIPMVVENVRGAQKWVGRARANYGSFYLWGDVGMVGHRVVPIVNGRILGKGIAAARARKIPGFRFDGESHGSFQSAAVKVAGLEDGHFPAGGLDQGFIDERKNDGGSWFAIGGPGQTVTGQNPDGRKTPGRNLSKGSANKFGTHNMGSGAVMMEELGVKVPGISLSAGKSVGFNVTDAQRYREQHGKQNIDGGGTKISGDWFGSYAEQKAAGTISPGRLYGKNSNSRKAASAMIAKIPYALALHIARCFHPIPVDSTSR